MNASQNQLMKKINVYKIFDKTMCIIKLINEIL